MRHPLRVAAQRAAVPLFWLLASLAFAQTAPPPELPSGWTDKEIVYTDRDMVVAANPLAVRAGVDVLNAGGSAVDAAIAVQMVLNLVEPQSSGIGGGAFIVHWDAAAQKVETYDGRETAPAAATPSLFLDANGQPLGFAAAQIGGRSVGTPGVLRALQLAHREHGRLPWAKLFEPAIALADNGFAVSPRLYAALVGANAALRTGPVTGPYFYQADGTPKPVGTILRNPDLAATLRAIAAGGADAFYAGPIADDIVATVRGHPTNPGLLAAADFAAYRAIKRDPVCGTYRGKRICGMGMPSSGTVTMLMTLAMIEGFDVRAMGANSVDAVHLIAEAYRLAYADRAQYMADADFVSVPVAGLLDRGYLAERAKLISMARSMGVPAAGRPPGCCTGPQQANGVHRDAAGTSQVSIVDAQGNALSMTTTIESGFGSHLMVRGFLLNNELTDFSFTPTDSAGRVVANRVEPGKRPRSSMTPVLVFDDRMRLDAVLGSPGGSAIIQYVTKTVVGLYDWNLNVQQAINLGNFGAQTSATTQLERGSPVAALADPLRSRGHTVSVVDLNSGLHGITFAGARDDGNRSGLWAILRPYQGWAGGADPRREGTALGN
ncbi:MAG TPA: gamma-glutamyltransferase [Casimicrobiaceae bacterium]|nr:gamma-glutamyltransferase [Casimicrobiaceae bacterium]